MWQWLVRQWQWPAASIFAAIFLLAFCPFVWMHAGIGMLLVYVQLPLYMLHQGEEHLGDRFRLYMNRTIGGGCEVLTPAATFVINAVGVWLFDVISFSGAYSIGVGVGLAAGYLSVVNAILHIGPAIRKREANPGLVSAAGLLLPAGLWCVVANGSAVEWSVHLLALLAAIAVHVAIVVYVAYRLHTFRLSSASLLPGTQIKTTCY